MENCGRSQAARRAQVQHERTHEILDDERFDEIRSELVGRLRRAVEAARQANDELAAFEQAHPQGHAALALRAGIGLVLNTVRDGCWSLELN